MGLALVLRGSGVCTWCDGGDGTMRTSSEQSSNHISYANAHRRYQSIILLFFLLEAHIRYGFFIVSRACCPVNVTSEFSMLEHSTN
jgi:hypothetical protein